MVEFDHMITVKKKEDNQNIEDIINPCSKFETVGLAEICINQLNKGDVIQLERRGYYYIDSLATQDTLLTLHFIPDGRSKSMSTVGGKVIFYY